MKLFTLTLTLLALIACAEEPEPECELAPYDGTTLMSDRIVDTGEVYERWCGPRFIGEVDGTEKAMVEACGPRGLEVEERWECQAWNHTNYDGSSMLCDCRPTPE